jgi:uncharacterized SAM-binding protein YcdF (DUF218 family)
VLGTVLLAWLASLLGVLFFASRDTAEASDAIVVLGAAQYAGRPSPVLKSRLDHAHNLWKEKLGRRLILTGGQRRGDVMSEAEAGRAYLRKLGVPDTVMLLERKGRNTDESIRSAASLMRDSHLESAILVSDPFHMFRLRIVAWGHGLHVRSSPTRTSPISANRLQVGGYILSESVKAPLMALLILVQ